MISLVFELIVLVEAEKVHPVLFWRICGRPPNLGLGSFRSLLGVYSECGFLELF